ncbi:TIGR03986 family CRISPR-associated RAMP protein [Neolewinella lacunae]|uniref:TIGR03986 family CRISPR-associated RAMP protein n=1 Tax=Neolewinella lacunae TaxID=1517758 RepID=A0A923T9N5_9BACT|nr:TIGR03986 family CRISPR-associated RAMP protein [Neolewinella lacunae]MBC6995248.1 TIGR03986 family CRISPR-associated RAMP protein [Neolewinella lacunae]MDN3635443.1 TIGR03986 family CRISPR-associated RAMP protein [Neolewinella lacunae]
MTLKVPYNFVPLNNKVVTPYWMDHISHDVPFKDGKSGTLKLTLTAESPIFVRRGEAKPAKNNDERTGAQDKAYEFEQDPQGNYFIPGSSIRGMVRSVVETLSFGRMIGRVSERRYALRDLSGSMKEEYLSHFKVNADVPVRGGWLRYDRDNDQYVLRDADIPGRISHRELESQTGVLISKYFSVNGAFDQRKDKEKAAKRKYDMFAEQHKSSWYEESKDFVHLFEDAGRKIYGFTQEEEEDQVIYPGRIVMTGQPGPRKQVEDKKTKELKWTGKQYEFIFWDFDRPQDIIVPQQVVENFKFAYFDDNPKEQSEDYKWRSKLLENGEEIPVFWKRGVSKDGQPTVEHFGLSYLYKLPYDNTVEGSIKSYQKKTAANHDLADAIFGMVGTKEEKSPLGFLKGRVQFTHAKRTVDGGNSAEKKAILGEPRASFYPTYMNQNVNDSGHTGRYNTFMDDKPIAGRKRYPVLNEGTRKTSDKDENGRPLSEAVFTKFLPLDKGTTFTCELYYHNLREIELGALISALTFHGSDKSRHQVGMAKPLGFGKIKVEVAGISPEEQAELMLRFEAFMDTELGSKVSWRNSEQVKEIIALTNPVNPTDVPVLAGNFPYNTLNEFRQVKQNQEALRLHSKMRGDDLMAGLADDLIKKKGFQDEILKDKAHFESIKPMTSERALDRTITATQKIKQGIQGKVQERIEVYRAQLAELKREEERAETEARNKEKQAAASESGLDLSTIRLDRDAISKMKKVVDTYLERLRGKRSRDFTTEDWLLPESDWETLISKVREIYESNRANRDFEHAKQSVKTQEILTQWLGEERMRAIWNNLGK